MKTILITKVEVEELEYYQPLTTKQIDAHDIVIVASKFNFRVLKIQGQYINPKHIYHLTSLPELIRAESF